ncbi:MAG: glycosyltransferase [Candidatus Berkelbacteria bacterium]|nr:glycosyltransferase [Candidatus Berkelbacteria bacterium]
MFYPKVSIVIPVYNGANHLREAINSALAQTYENIEVLVINDGSDDDGSTEAIAKSYGDKVCYFYKKNGGVASALNFGIKKMSGEYFSWLSHDDLYRPNKILIQIKYLQAHSGDSSIILFSDFTLIDRDKKILSKAKIKGVTSKNLYYRLISTSPIHGCSLLIPKRCFPSKNPFNIKLRATQDYDLWFRMCTNYRFIHQPKDLIFSRLHKEQDTLKKTAIVRLENINLNNKYLGRLKKVYCEEPIDKLREIYLECAFGLVEKYFFPSANIAFKLYAQTKPRITGRVKSAIRFDYAKLYLLASASIGYVARKIRKTIK